MKKNHLLLIILFLSNILYTFSQQNDLNLINKYNSESGLSSNYIYQIIQDNQGFIWIGTEEGLNKFDGKHFTSFSTKKGRYQLSHNRAQALILAPDSNVWVGTSYGINIYDYKSDSIIQVTTTTSPLKLVYNDITCFSKSLDKSTTWIGTYGNGVNFYNWKTHKFNRLHLPSVQNVAQPIQVMSLLEDRNKNLWIGTQNNGLYRYNILHKRLEYCKLNDNNLFIKIIYSDSMGRIWVGTSKGCYIYNEANNRFDLVQYPTALSTSSIETIHEDRSGKLWIGTDVILLNFPVWSFKMNEIYPYQLIPQGESSFMLNCPAITSLLSDRDDNMWIGTVWGGLNKLQGKQSKFRLFKHEPAIENSLPLSPITGICSAGKDYLYVTTNNKGLHKMSLKENNFKQVNIQSGSQNYNYQNVLTDDDDNIWLGTFKNGLVKLNKAGAVIAEFKLNAQDPNSLPGNDVRDLYLDKKNRIWVATNKGIAIINPKKNRIEKVIRLRNNTGIRVIKEDNAGLFWIGTYGAGVATYNPVDGKIAYEVTNSPINSVYDILVHRDSIWFVTHGQGVLLYNSTKKTERIYSEKEGMATNFGKSILRDKNGSVWIGTSNGISSIQPATSEILNYSDQDGVQTQGMMDHSSYQLPDGQMVFGGGTGMIIFDPLKVFKNDHCPPIVFTKLSVFNQLITPAGENSALKENISIAKEIDLNFKQSVFMIEFIGLNYNSAQKIQYAYLLKGADLHWNYIGNQNNITFRNLSPGKYTLFIKASSPDGVWSDDNISSIDIIIRPPLWRTWWAYLLYIVVFGCIIYFVSNFLKLKVRSANDLKIERAKRETEQELHQEKLQFFTNISHEFRTPLTLLIGPLERLLREETNEAKKSNIRLMQRNAKRLFVMVNQLLDFRKVEKNQMKLNVQFADINAFIKEIMLSYDELRVLKNIQFEFVYEHDTELTWFDPEFIDKCLFNLLSNAFKFTPDYGSITVATTTKTGANGEKTLELSVSDNGKGIKPEEIELIFNQFYKGKESSAMQPGSGIGLHLAQSLVKLHHGDIRVESVALQKTVFTLSIPADKNVYAKDELNLESKIAQRQPNYSVQSEVDEIKAEATGTTTRKAHGKKILLVEDNQEIRNYIKEILGSNYWIDEAENGVQGLKMAPENEYNLIVCDWMMPEMDGIEMCKLLKSNLETNHIPIIMLTAKSSIESRIEGLNVGADSYISKPFHPDHLTIRVSKLIEQRELFQHKFAQKISLGSLKATDEPAETVDDQFIRHAIELILDKMIETEFNGDVLALNLGISRMGLHRKIKSLTGQSTGEFIRNVRLKKASELLSMPGKNISEVCYDVGFSSPSYFTTCFTEAYKMTPSEYIKSIKK